MVPVRFLLIYDSLRAPEIAIFFQIRQPQFRCRRTSPLALHSSNHLALHSSNPLALHSFNIPDIVNEVITVQWLTLSRFTNVLRSIVTT